MSQLFEPYENPRHLDIPFGSISYYLKPWRAYMDTWPASRFLETLGVNFRGESAELNAMAQLLAEAGVRSGRIEVSPGQFTYDDPTVLRPAEWARLTDLLFALKQHGIRPLLLLNANSGWPVPIREIAVNVQSPAAQGARQITVAPTSEIRPGYTGFGGMAYQIGYPLITAYNPSTGQCTLSAPLPQPVAAGQRTLYVLKYQPFAGAVFQDGTPNPAAEETVAGWMTFVRAVCTIARNVLQTPTAPDAGFDLEVWNEYSFGSHFLSDEHYYSPPRQYSQPIRYRNHGLTAEGPELILPMTVDYVNDPANNLPGVKVISGFSNQRPWESGATMWPGQDGFSRHYYTGGNPRSVPPDKPVINALGEPDGSPPFNPASLRVSMPEWWFYGYQTEHVVRDLSPVFSSAGSPIGNTAHFRFARREGGKPAEVWMTETNFNRKEWGEQVAAAAGVAYDSPRVQSLLHAIGAKALLRLLLFHAHKGIETVNVYVTKDYHGEGFELFPAGFFTALAQSNYQVTETVRAAIGPQVTSLSRVTRLLRAGGAIGVTRPIAVAKLVENQPRRLFAGDGTAAHPDRWHRDDFAVLPFQTGAGQYAVAYYVVTQNLVQEWNTAADRLDPARYTMPDQTFDLTLSNVRGAGAAVSAYDPLTDQPIAVQVVGATATTLTVRVAAGDAPRILTVTEAAPGPLIESPAVVRQRDGRVTVSFTTNLNAAPRVTWGAPPERTGGGQIDLPAGRTHQATIAVGPGHAVRITAVSDGLEAVWPRWGHDLRGVPTEGGNGGAEPGDNLVPPFTDPRWGQPPGVRYSADGTTATLDNRNQRNTIILRSPDLVLTPGHTYQAACDITWTPGATPIFAVRRGQGEWVYSTDYQRIAHPVTTFTVPPDYTMPYWIELGHPVANRGVVTFANVSLRDMSTPPAPGGSILLNHGAPFTKVPTVTATISATGATEMRFSFDGSTWAPWEPLAPTRSLTLPGGDDTKTVHVQFRSSGGQTSAPARSSILLDTTPPKGAVQGLPPQHTGTTFPVAWTAADGTGGSGVASVKLYYSTNGGSTWTQYGATYATSPITFTAPGTGTYTFSLRAADRAGNEEPVPSGANSVQASTTVGPTNLLPTLSSPAWSPPVAVDPANQSITLTARSEREPTAWSPDFSLTPGRSYLLVGQVTVQAGARGRITLRNGAGDWSYRLQVNDSRAVSATLRVPPTLSDTSHHLEVAALGVGDVTYTNLRLTEV